MFVYSQHFSLSVYLLLSALFLTMLLLLLLLERFRRRMVTRREGEMNEENVTADTIFERMWVNLEILFSGLLSKRE